MTQVNVDFAALQHLNNVTDQLQQEQATTNQAHDSRNAQAAAEGFGGPLSRAAMSVGLDRGSVFQHSVFDQGQVLVQNNQTADKTYQSGHDTQYGAIAAIIHGA